MFYMCYYCMTHVQGFAHVKKVFLQKKNKIFISSDHIYTLRDLFSSLNQLVRYIWAYLVTISDCAYFY